MTPAVLPVAVVLLAAALAAATYFTAGRPAPGLWPAVGGRAVAWGVLSLLLLNSACPDRSAGGRPLVLLDESPSLLAAGGRAAEARALADSIGEVRPFAGSLLRPALIAAAGSGRPVFVVSDGEILDRAELPADLLTAASVRILPRLPVPDLAVVRLEAPRRVAAGDSLTLRADLRAIGDSTTRTIEVEARGAGRVLARTVVSLGPGGATAVLEAGRVTLPAGEHVIEVGITGSADAEPRTDRRLHLLSVAATPGVVLVADPAGWEARFLFRALVEVAALPVQGFLRLEPDRWRRMSDLGVVGEGAVREAIREADLLISVGTVHGESGRSRARGRWDWPALAPLEGDWYLTPTGLSPLAGALAGIPAESLPPATALAPLEPPSGGWVGWTAQAGRRGAERVAVMGTIEGGRRRMVVGASGLWRWALRGGVAGEAYRAWVAGSASWLLAAPDSAAGPLRVLRAVVERDMPVPLAWAGDGEPTPVPVTLEGPGGIRQDTVAFDAGGRSSFRLPPGTWRYATGTGSSGIVVVEEYSREFLPAAATLAPAESAGGAAGRGRGTREVAWLFGLAVLAWCVEWGARRRAGLR